MRSKTLAIALMMTLSACATPGYRPISADIINSSVNAPKDIGSDALEVSKVHVFDDSTFNRIQAAIKAKPNDREKADAVRGVLCEVHRHSSTSFFS